MISIVTVNYQNFTALKACWESLKKSGFEDFEWIIVDNNSPKNEGHVLSEYFEKQPNVFVVTLNQNIGFGGACDEGVSFAKGESLIFMNPDIVVGNDTIAILKSTIDSDDAIGIVVPQLHGENKKTQENVRKFPTVMELFGRRLVFKNEGQKRSQGNNLLRIDWAQGSFFMMTKKFFLTLGGFDHRFFLFMEDTDLCRRCWEAGKSVVLNPKAIAIHGEQRLSGGHLVTAIFKKTFWIHLVSMVKYFYKYRGKSNPRTK